MASDAVDISVLKEQLRFPFAGRVIPNRFYKAPLTEKICTYNGSDIYNRGKPTEQYIRLYEKWGQGGLGIIATGNILVHREHLEAPGNLIVENEEHLDLLVKVREVAKKNGSVFIGQINHPGRQSPDNVQKYPVSCSDVQLPNGFSGCTYAKPTPLSKQGIEDIVQRFANTAEVLYKAGWDGVQVHCAHGYLLSQFLSPRVNRRTDEYGGSLENRSRIIFEIIRAIRTRITDKTFVLGVKLNSGDFTDGGFSPEESKELALKFEEVEVDYIELSGGTYESDMFEAKRESTKRREAFFIEFADNIRPHLKRTLLCVTGGFRSARAMVEAIDSKSTDLIGLGRPVCAEPLFAKEILEGKKTVAKKAVLPGLVEAVGSFQQIIDISEGREPTDYSQPTTVLERAALIYRIGVLLGPMLNWEGVKQLTHFLLPPPQKKEK